MLLRVEALHTVKKSLKRELLASISREVETCFSMSVFLVKGITGNGCHTLPLST